MALPHGALVKRDRAKHLLEVINNELQRVEDGYREAVVHKIEAEGREHVYSVEGLPTVAPQLSAILGDFFHNLRSCLDHLAYAAANPPSESTCFPILDVGPTPNRYDRRKPPSIAGVASESFLEAVESVQPYKRSVGQSHTDPLWVLHRLDIIDKHRELLLAVALSTEAGWATGGHEIIGKRGAVSPKDGEEIYRFTIPSSHPEPDIDPDPDFSFRVCFGPAGEADAVLGQAAGPLLEDRAVAYTVDWLWHDMYYVVLPRLSPFFI